MRRGNPENLRGKGNRFKPGQSGNPGGRPKDYEDVRELARKFSRPAIEALAQIVRNKDLPPAPRVSAASVLLDRGYGKPLQTIETKRSPIDDLTIDQLVQLLGQVEEAIAAAKSDPNVAQALATQQPEGHA